MYVSYRCTICNTEFIIPTQTLTKAELEGKYLTCPLDGRHKVVVCEGRYDDLKECMKHDRYKKENGAVRQTGWAE